MQHPPKKSLGERSSTWRKENWGGRENLNGGELDRVLQAPTKVIIEGEGLQAGGHMSKDAQPSDRPKRRHEHAKEAKEKIEALCGHPCPCLYSCLSCPFCEQHPYPCLVPAECKGRYGRMHQVGKMSFYDKNMQKSRLKQHTKAKESQTLTVTSCWCLQYWSSPSRRRNGLFHQ